MTDLHHNRRDFIKKGLGLSAFALAPSLGFENLSLLADAQTKAPKVLCVLELAGGNDGLSTLIPYADDVYHRSRSATRHTKKSILTLNDELGFNPALKPLMTLWDRGDLAVLPGCGYPNPNRSHFESMDIWHAGDLKGKSADRGWLGRLADEHAGKNPNPEFMVSVGAGSPLAMLGRRVKPVTLREPQNYRIPMRRKDEPRHLRLTKPRAAAESELAFLRQVAVDAKDSSARIRRAVAGYRSKVRFPGDRLAQDFRIASALIASGLKVRILYLRMGGFDTHVNQRNRHDALMRRLSAAMFAFHEDLKRSGHSDRVSTLVFSEFGRRLKENASFGTDHGAAGLMLLAGAPVKGGVRGKHPSLTDLDARGDLKATQDFREVYAQAAKGVFTTS